MARRSRTVDYETETDDDVDWESETTIETSFMNLLSPVPFCIQPIPAPVPTPVPTPESESECTVFDTYGPISDNGSVCGSVIQVSILLSTTLVAALYILMGAYTYPEWP